MDESKETYVKNHLDLDDINENKQAEEEQEKEKDPEAALESGTTAEPDDIGGGGFVSPSAPADTSSGGGDAEGSGDSPV